MVSLSSCWTRHGGSRIAAVRYILPTLPYPTPLGLRASADASAPQAAIPGNSLPSSQLGHDQDRLCPAADSVSESVLGFSAARLCRGLARLEWWLDWNVTSQGVGCASCTKPHLCTAEQKVLCIKSHCTGDLVFGYSRHFRPAHKHTWDFDQTCSVIGVPLCSR